MYTLNCKGKLLSLEKPVVMGILNATYDSFYKGDLSDGLEGILKLASKMICDGAAILDVGGQSTKPGSIPVVVDIELQLVIPVIELIHRTFPEAIISVDTFYSEVAIAAVAAGASMVNDVSGGEMDKNMTAAIANLQVPFVCMHMKGTPENMNLQNQYDDILKEMLDYFVAKVHAFRTLGIKDVIIDPGFGFAKNASQNFYLLKHLSIFKMLECPILAGLSRKSTIYKTLNITASDALNGTSVLNTLALNNGANILRVHDVKEAVEVIALHEAYKKA